MANYSSATFQNHEATERRGASEQPVPRPALPSADGHHRPSGQWVRSQGATVARKRGDGQQCFMAQACVWKRGILSSGPGLPRTSCGKPLNKKITSMENLLLLGKAESDHDQLQHDFPKPPSKKRGVQG